MPILYFYRLLFYFNPNQNKEKEGQSVNGYVVRWTEELLKKNLSLTYL